MITLELPPQIQSTIEKESQQVGMSVEQYIISKLMPTKTKNPKRQLEFMKGEITVPNDIHSGDDEILAEFGEKI